MRFDIKLTQQATGVFRIWCPDLPGCVACGQSAEEARQRIEQSIRGYLATLHAAVPQRLDLDVMETATR